MSAPVQPVVHTPGPWELGDENNQCCEVLLGVEHNLTIDLDRQDNNTGKFVIERDEMLANARLIAAAPDLLAACLAFVEADNQCGANLAFVMAQEAVKKAGIAPKENGGETCDMKHGPCSCGATH